MLGILIASDQADHSLISLELTRQIAYETEIPRSTVFDRHSQRPALETEIFCHRYLKIDNCCQTIFSNEILWFFQHSESAAHNSVKIR